MSTGSVNRGGNARLATAVSAAQQRWPAVIVAAETFVAYVHERTDDPGHGIDDLRLVQSNVDVSAERLLQTEAPSV